MILDFSKSNLVIANQDNETWQKAILDFLDNWLDKSKTIKVNTSGSTGKPKEIELKKESMKKSALSTGEFLQLKNEDKALLCLPINYIAGKMMLVRASVLGLKLICVKPSTKIEINEPIEFTAMTPMQVNESIHFLHKFKKVIIGGASVQQSLIKKIIEIPNTQFYETYGMTETISHIAMKNINQNEDFFTTLPFIEVSKDERDCLKIKVPYLPNEEIVTNDLVEIIDKNKFILKGRIDNVINSGGIKISPEVVENKLAKFIESEFFISSIKDNQLGEKLVLLIKGDRNEELENRLSNIFTEFLLKYERPKEIIFVKDFPKTTNGKIIRNQLKK